MYLNENEVLYVNLTVVKIKVCIRMRCLDLILLREGKFHIYCLDSHELLHTRLCVFDLL